MPRTYVPKKDNPNKAYSEKDLNDALNSVTNNELSLSAASKRYKIPKGTLFNRYHGKYGIKKYGGQTVLGEDEENILVRKILVCSDWGYPLDRLDIRMLVKSYLDKEGRSENKFKDNMPGVEWASSFLKRHKSSLSVRVANNIKLSRAKVGKDVLEKYHNNLSKCIEENDIQPEDIYNYDETNLSDNPAAKKYIFRRGMKHPDNVGSFTKSCVTVMFGGSASGILLPPFVVYKSENMYTAWTQRGPKGPPCCNEVCCRAGPHYSNTKSGWFDMQTFRLWFETCFLPQAKRTPRTKLLIGDNLSSHFSYEVIVKAEENNIMFVSLPANATHLAQPLDVAFFRPIKSAWQSLLMEFKKRNPNKSSVDKCTFPSMLNNLLNHPKFKNNIPSNLQSGFAATGIYPSNLSRLLKRLPSTKAALDSTSTTSTNNTETNIDECLQTFLKKKRFPDNMSNTTTGCVRKRGVKVLAGTPITSSSFTEQAATTNGEASDSTSTTRVKVTSQPRNGTKKSEKRKASSSDNNMSVPPEIPVKPYDLHDYVLVKVPASKSGHKVYVAQVLKIEKDSCQVQFYKSISVNLTKFVICDEEPSWVDKAEIHSQKPLPIPVLNNRHHYVFPEALKVSV